MSDQRGLLSLDAPAVDQSRLRARAGVEAPKPAPSLLEQFSVAARGAAANDDPAADQARQQEAIDQALAPLVEDLKARGIAGDFTARRARDGFALSYNEDAIWQGIARARAADPKAFEGVDKDPAAFRQRVTAPVRARIAGERDVQQRSGWVPWLAGQFAGGASDPINQAAMLAGLGPARSIAQAALRDAVVNVQTEAVQAPVRAIAKAKQGQATTPGEVATDLAMAAGTGAAFGGAVHGAGEIAGKVAARIKGPAGQLADQMRAAIGIDRMTDAERAAVATLDRIDETAATSPFLPGAGSDGHLARVDRAMAQLATPGEVAAPAPPTPARFDERHYANQVAIAESGGKWQVQAPTSSAYGLYQITRGTFIRVARTLRGNERATDETLWAQRTHPAMQEAVFNAITRSNRAALARAGIPETNGNLYVLHFAGEAGGTKILRAAGDTPIEQLMSARAIEANPWLKGKTADDIVAWAHRKMGDSPREGPVLSREGFADDAAGDAEWRAAQAEVDAAERELARVAAEDAGARTPPPADDDVPFDLDDPRARVIVDPDSDPFGDLPGDDAAPVGMDWDPNPDAPMPAGQRFAEEALQLEAAGGGEIPAALDHPDVGTIDVKWGDAGDAAKNWRGGYGLAHILAKHPEMRAQLPDLPAIIRGMEVVKDDGRTIRLASARHEAGVRLDWDGASQRWLVTAYEKGRNAQAMLDTPAAPVSSRDAAVDRASPDRGAREDMGDGAAPGKPVVEGFDSPDDVAALRQMDSLEHDLRMFLLEDDARGLTVRLNEEGDVINAADAIAELDQDEAAIAAARACMVPPGGDMA